MNLARLISTVHNQKNSYMNGYLKALGLSHGQAITLKIIHEENCIKQDDLNKRLPKTETQNDYGEKSNGGISGK